MRLMNRLGLLQLAFTLVIGLSHALPVSAQQIAQSPALGAGVNGRNAASVSVGKEGRKTGEFRQQGPGRWVEIDGSERQTYRFDEVRRDDWSVYLIDRSRNVNLQLDLHTRKVMIGEAKGGRRELYQILAAGTQGAQAQQQPMQRQQIQQQQTQQQETQQQQTQQQQTPQHQTQQHQTQQRQTQQHQTPVTTLPSAGPPVARSDNAEFCW